MFVNDCMTRHPIMIQADMLASEAQRLMAENGIRHLPVIGQGKKLEGLVTRSSFSISPDVLGSLNVWDISRRLSNVKVADMMVPGRKVITTHPDRTVERAAAIINEHRIGCLPVIDGDIVVGIITEADLMNALQQMLGLPADGVRVTIRIPNKKGEFSKLMAVLAQQEWGVMGIGTYPSRQAPDSYDIVLKIPNASVEEATRVLQKVPGQQRVDIRTTV